ncbi:MAG: PepSY domain-containing protein [Burkholderiales bacterium]|nr:PepSY domain-containing protein [Burkholderiales bacterium]
MRIRIPVIAAAAAVVFTGVAVVSVRAATENDAFAVEQAQISLAQAVSAAERHIPGSKASRAEYESSRDHGRVFDVELVAHGKAYDVQVDANKGVVVASAEARIDRDADHDARD